MEEENRLMAEELDNLRSILETAEEPCPTPFRRNSTLASSSEQGLAIEIAGQEVVGPLILFQNSECLYEVSGAGGDLQITFEGDGQQIVVDNVEIKVDTGIKMKISERLLNEELLFILRRTEQYQNVAIEGENKNHGEDDRMKLWPFRISTVRGSVSYEHVSIEGDTTHFGARVNFNNNNEATLTISKIGIRLTTNEREKIKKTHSGKIWELQILDPFTLEKRAAAKIQVLKELRPPNKRKLIAEPRNAKRTKLAPSDDDWGETILSFFGIMDAMVIPLGFMSWAKFNEEELFINLTNGKADIRNMAYQFILNHYDMSGEFNLDDMHFSITLKTLSKVGKTIFDKQHGGPIEALHNPEWIEPLRDSSGKKYHVIKVTANVKAMMEALNNYRQH